MPVVWSAVFSSILPNVGGWVGGCIVNKNMMWYESLNRPTWRPPNWAFGPVWTSLYTGMGYASYLVWRDGGGFEGPSKIPLYLYGSQLMLNWAWTPIFFGAHNIPLSLFNIGLLWINVAACGISFYNVNKTAGFIMVPYLVWLTLAAALNYSINRSNPKIKEDKEE